jgi:hypothetical protein
MRVLGRTSAAEPEPEAPGPPKELLERRDELSRRFAELQWDLGGLAYEMAIRDHFRLHVLVRKAAELQEADAELGEVERLLADAERGGAGQCRACGAPHSRGAAFCWRCGQTLMLQAQSTLVGAAVVPPPIPPPLGGEQPTAPLPPVDGQPVQRQ